MVQLPTWLMERTTPPIKELQTPADLERRQERSRMGKKETEVLVSFKEKGTVKQAVLKKDKSS